MTVEVISTRRKAFETKTDSIQYSPWNKIQTVNHHRGRSARAIIRSGLRWEGRGDQKIIENEYHHEFSV